MNQSSKHLRRAAVSYLIGGLSLLAFGFPFWFLNAVDTMPKGRYVPPFFYLVDDLLMIPIERWVQLVGCIGLLAGAVSLWKAGEPTGFRAGRRVLLVPIAGSICYILSVWVVLPFAPMGAALNGLGMILVGYVSLKSGVWTGWKRYTPMIVGLFPFVFMFPLLILTGARPPAMIGLWGFAWLLLAFAAWQRATELNRLKLS